MADEPNPNPTNNEPPVVPPVEPPVVPPVAPVVPVVPPTEPPAPVVPDTYALKLADGSALDASDVATVAEYAKANKLTQEQASAYLTSQETVAKGALDRKDAAQQTERDSWIQLVTNDKDLGGEKLGETAKLTMAAMERFAPGKDHPFRKYLNETGLGNHPDVVRTFVAIGKAMAEDKPPAAQPGAGGTFDKEAALANMYPSMAKK